MVYRLINCVAGDVDCWMMK